MVLEILTFLVVLSVLVLVHEFGHYIMARRAGIWVEEFGFGLPPRVIGKKIGETIYSINLLPFGGFVRLHGENDEEGVTKPNRAFIFKDKKTRSGIVVAGVVMNFILAIAAFTTVYSFSGIPRETKDVKVVDIAKDSPASSSGLLVGDIIRKVRGETITEVKQFIDLVEKDKGKRVEIEIERNSSPVKLSVVPRENPPAGEGPLGVTITTTEVYYPPFWQRPFVGIYYGFKEALFWSNAVLSGFAKIFNDLFVGQVPKDLAGPVGIFAITTQAAKFGILALINFLGILSVNLAILNILPFPALDGGRLLFIGIEAVMGRKVIPKIESTIHTVGMIILLVLLVAITAHDIQRIIAAGGISGFLNSVLK